MRPAVICDVDGTLCDTSSVNYLIESEPPDYSAFYQATSGCPVRPSVRAALVSAQDSGLSVLMVTSREFIWRDLTLDWLQAHEITYQGLYMRRASDFRSAEVVKGELFEQLRQDGFEPVQAWEDSPKIAALWRSLGVADVQLVAERI